jgi:hypothetical protein
MRYIKTLNRIGEGGSCANCNDGYTGTGFKKNGMRERGMYNKQKQGYRVLVEWLEGGSYIQEPVNLCKECHTRIQDRGKL